MVRLTTLQGTELVQLLNMAKEGNPTAFATFQELVDLATQVTDQLNHQDYEADLIGEIVDILGRRRAGTVLSGDALEALRKALLRPTEIAKFRALANKAQSCDECGLPIPQMGLTTLYHGKVHCPGCAIPEVIACQVCKNPLNMPNAISRVIAKLNKECPICADRKANPKKDVDVAAMDEAAPIPDEFWTSNDSVGRAIGAEQMRAAPRPARVTRMGDPAGPFTVAPPPTMTRPIFTATTTTPGAPNANWLQWETTSAQASQNAVDELNRSIQLDRERGR